MWAKISLSDGKKSRTFGLENGRRGEAVSGEAVIDLGITVMNTQCVGDTGICKV